MSRSTFRRAALPVCAILLAAGCSEAPAELADDQVALSGVADADFEGGGTIRGLVTDEELNPIAGALVQIGDDITVTSTDNGAFEAINLRPGDHRVIAQALGYQSVARTVTVEPGGATEVSFQLTKLAIVEPYHDFFAMVGFACLQTYTFGTRLTYGNFACPDAPASVLVQFEATRGVETIVSEMAWQQTSALSARVLGIDLWQGGVRTGVWTCDYCYGSAEGESPVILRVDGEFEGVNGEDAESPAVIDNIVILRGDPTFADQVGLIYNQRVEVYTSVFYFAEAPNGYTGLPDS